MTKNKIKYYLKNISYTLSSNVLSTIISAVIILVVPKRISVNAYGYYQLYLFYTSYVAFSYFGWCDGIYLRMGGKYYKDLDKPLYSVQFWLLCIFEVFIYTVIFGISCFASANADRHFVMGCTCVAGIVICLRWFAFYILQATARFKESAVITISERVIFVVFVVGLLLMGYKEFYLIVAADVLAKFISLLISVFYCHDIIFGYKRLPIKFVFSEIYKNISAGIKLLFSSLCGMLLIGFTRFCIQSHWDIATFSKVSVTLSLSNMVMNMIYAITAVVYPMLRRTGDDKLPMIYGFMRIILMGLIFFGLIFYYPAQKLLGIWLPQYIDSLRYAAILLPVCVYDSKMSMLVNTYFKALRLENTLMKCNIAAVVVSAGCSILSVFVLDNVTMAIISILISIVFRGIMSELILSRYIAIEVKKDIFLELGMTIVFIVCNWFFGFAGMCMYAFCYVLYLLFKKNDLRKAVRFIKEMR